MTANHDGHRERMRQRIESYGIESLQPHEILEYLLYAHIPRKDTNEIAHELISHFGSLSKVFEADVVRLSQIKGMTKNAALFITTLPKLSSIYSGEKRVKNPLLNTTQKCVDYIRPLLENLLKEEVWILLKDSGGKLVQTVKAGEGSITSCNISARSVADLALKHGAVSVVIAHNHPSGVAKPSFRDVGFTRQLAVALNLIGIRLDDHIIIAGDEYYSFRVSGELDNIDNSRISLVNGQIGDVEF